MHVVNTPQGVPGGDPCPGDNVELSGSAEIHHTRNATRYARRAEYDTDEVRVQDLRPALVKEG